MKSIVQHDTFWVYINAKGSKVMRIGSLYWIPSRDD